MMMVLLHCIYIYIEYVVVDFYTSFFFSNLFLFLVLLLSFLGLFWLHPNQSNSTNPDVILPPKALALTEADRTRRHHRHRDQSILDERVVS